MDVLEIDEIDSFFEKELTSETAPDDICSADANFASEKPVTNGDENKEDCDQTELNTDRDSRSALDCLKQSCSRSDSKQTELLEDISECSDDESIDNEIKEVLEDVSDVDDFRLEVEEHGAVEPLEEVSDAELTDESADKKAIDKDIHENLEDISDLEDVSDVVSTRNVESLQASLDQVSDDENWDAANRSAHSAENDAAQASECQPANTKGVAGQGSAEDGNDDSVMASDVNSSRKTIDLGASEGVQGSDTRCDSQQASGKVSRKVDLNLIFSEGRLMYIEGLQTFYIQRKEEGAVQKDLEAQMEPCQKNKGLFGKSDLPIENEMYGVKWKEQLYRVKVVGIESSSEKGVKVNGRLIDRGQKFVVDAEELFTIPVSVKRIPPLCTSYVLHNLEPVSNLTPMQQKMIMKFMYTMLHGKSLDVVSRSAEYPREVEIFVGNESLNEKLLEREYMVKKDDQLSEISLSLSDTPSPSVSPSKRELGLSDRLCREMDISCGALTKWDELGVENTLNTVAS